MDRRTRAYKLYQVGAEAHSAATDLPDAECLLYAIAAMIDAAVKPKKTAAIDNVPLPFTATNVYDRLRDECPRVFLYEPIDSTWFSRLNKQIRQLDVDVGALDKLVLWFGGGRPSTESWNMPLPFNSLVMNFKKWLAEAVAWTPGKVAGHLPRGQVRFIRSSNNADSEG